MKTTEFKGWLEAFERMSRGQRDKIRVRLQKKEKGDKGIELIEKCFMEQSACPHCTGTALYRWGTSCGLQRYRCRNCNRTFNSLTHTPLAGLHHKDKWLNYEQAMIQGLSIRKAAISCGIAKNTSFNWRHRLLRAPAKQQPAQMSGIAEADETFFLESFKGQRQLPRAARKRGGKAAKRGLSAEQIPVLVVRDRHGETADFVLPGTGAEQIEPVLRPLLNKDVMLCTDGAVAYKLIAKHAGIAHRPINVAAGQRVVGGIYHIQNVNAYDSRLKQWMARFHGVATRHLENYLGWHRMLDRLGNRVSPSVCLISSIGRRWQFQQVIAT